jgi:hypothetical protein
LLSQWAAQSNITLTQTNNMEELKNQIIEKLGISPEQASGAIDMVVNFLKDKLPAGLGETVQGLISGNAEGGAGDLLEKAKGLLGGFMK